MKLFASMVSKRSPKSIRMQIGFSFMLTSLIILLFSAIVIYNSELELFQKRTEESTLQLFRQADYTIQGFRKEVDTISKTILVDEGVQAARKLHRA